MLLDPARFAAAPKRIPHLSALPDARLYAGYHDLAAAQVEGEHYTVTAQHRPGASAAVLAPHGGRIEDGTSEIARAIAGEEHHLYLLEGRRHAHNYQTLHLTSHRFDEPRCLSLLAHADEVVAVHGCNGHGAQVLLGGRDIPLLMRLAECLRELNIETHLEGHRFPGKNPLNICNRGRRGMGVQLEVTHPLRRSSRAADVAVAVRKVLGRPHP
jgi:phage replication-related protein YjqB (UPF0714/DUF867 family)